MLSQFRGTLKLRPEMMTATEMTHNEALKEVTKSHDASAAKSRSIRGGNGSEAVKCQ